MKTVFVHTDQQLGYGEMKEASFVAIEGEVIKNKYGETGQQVGDPTVHEDDTGIHITFPKT